MSFVAAAKAGNSATATTLAVTLPAGLQAGDLLILVTAANTGSATCTVAGMTAVSGPDYSAASVLGTYIFKETLAAGQSGTTRTVTWSTTSRIAIAAVVLRGVDPASVLFTEATTNTSSTTSPTVTNQSGDTLVIACTRNTGSTVPVATIGSPYTVETNANGETTFNSGADIGVYIGVDTGTGGASISTSPAATHINSYALSVAPSSTGFSGTASQAGSGSLTTGGLVGAVASAVLAGSVAITAAGSVSSGLTGTAAVSGTGALTASGLVARSSSSTLGGTGVLSSSGQVGARATAAVGGAGALTAAGQVGISAGAANLVGIGVIGAAGSSVTGYQGASSPLTGTGTLTANGIMARASGATVAGTGALASSGVVNRSGGATTSGAGSVTATGTVGVQGVAPLTGISFLTASGVVATRASASVAGTGSLVATGSSVAGLLGVASRTGVGTISVTSVAGRTSPTSLPGAGSLVAAGSVGRSTSAVTAGVGALSSTGRVGAVSSSALAGSGALQAVGLVAAQSSAAVAGSGAITAIGIVEEAGFSSSQVHGVGSLVAEGHVDVVDVVVSVGTTDRRNRVTGGRRWAGGTSGRGYSVHLGGRDETVQLGERSWRSP